MTTPAGYFDEQGNFIPGSFADQLNLPSAPSADSAAAQAAQANLTKQQGALATSRQQAATLRTQLKRAQNQLGAKNLSAAKRTQITGLINSLKTQIQRADKAVTTGTAALPGLQNKVYEATGQYEKLLQGENRDAFAALKTMFDRFGLGSLAGKIYEYTKQGYGADVITMLLQDTSEYKERFAGNTARAKAGLPVLSPAEYLETESAYRQILNAAGLPKGFYDSPTDFRNWIAGDVSPTELKGRVDLAVANTMQANPATRQALQQMYGVDQSYLTAYFIDERRALPLLQKQSQAAQFGGEALKRGLTLNVSDLEDYVTAGLSLSQVSQGYQAVAEALPNIQAIAARYGEDFTQRELESELIAGVQPSGLGESRRKRLASQERALFSGFGGATPAGLSTGFQAT